MVRRRNFKLSGVLVAVLTVGLLVLLEVLAGPATRFSELVISQNEWLALMEDREETDADLLTRLEFNGENLAYDSSGERWFYSVVEGDSTAYDPSVRVSGGVSGAGGVGSGGASGVSLAVLEDRLSEEMVSKNEARKVMAYTDDAYRVYDVVMTTLPVMSIEYEGEGINNIDEYEMRMRLFDNRRDAKQRVTVSEGSFHARGATAKVYPKKSLSMNLTTESLGGNTRGNDISLLGMRADDDWILYAAYNDEERVRNVFASNLWMNASAENNKLGFVNGYEYKYTEVIMNGEYAGLYALGYQMDEKQAKLATDSSGEYTEFLFKKAYWDIEFDEDGEQIGEDNVLAGFELRLETKHEQEAWDFLEEYEEEVLEGEESGEIRRVTDMSTAIDMYLFLDFVQGVDNVDKANGLKNVFVTIKDKDEQKVVAYTPWDLDLTFGNKFSGFYPAKTMTRALNPENDFTMQNGPVWRLLEIEDRNIWAEIVDRYTELRRGAWSDRAISETLDEYEEQIFNSGAYEREVERWPEVQQRKVTKLEKFKEYVLERLEHMDETHGLSMV